MKYRRFFIPLCALLFSACGLTDDAREDEKRLSYPPIEDEQFAAYLLEYYDLNRDGYFSFYEAERILVVDCRGRDIASLSGIEHFVQLRELYCSDNRIQHLDLSQNSELQILDCARNGLLTLDVEARLALHTLDCSENALTRLDLVRTPALSTLDCSSNQLTLLDVTNCSYKMEKVDARFNPIELLYIGANQQIANLQSGGAEVCER